MPELNSETLKTVLHDFRECSHPNCLERRYREQAVVAKHADPNGITTDLAQQQMKVKEEG